jgi:hypothetical protein
MRQQGWVYSTLAIGVIAAALVARHERGVRPRMSFSNQSSAVMPKPISAPVTQRRESVPSLSEEQSLARQVEELVATKDPAKAFLAYQLIQECAEFNTQGDRMIFDEAAFRADPHRMIGYRSMTNEEKQHATKRCSQMTERERQSRLDYLTVAAKEGIREAAVAFAQEGPFGDPTALQTRPQDPLVQEWKAVAKTQLIRAAESGADMSALRYLASQNLLGSDLIEQNLLLAYRYNLASNMIDSDSLDSDSPLTKLFSENRHGLDEMVKSFPAEQRAAALSAARHIADKAREQRERPSSQ